MSYARSASIRRGEGGTYFQTAVTRRVLADTARLVIDGQTFTPWRDFIPRNQRELAPAVRALDGARAVYGGVFGVERRTIAPEATAGKVVLSVGFSMENGKLSMMRMNDC